MNEGRCDERLKARVEESTYQRPYFTCITGTIVPFFFHPPPRHPLFTENFRFFTVHWVCVSWILLLGLVVYYESIKRELKIRCIYECRCDERLQTKTKEFTRLGYTGDVELQTSICLENRLKIRQDLKDYR
jgi:hypothetical protein